MDEIAAVLDSERAPKAARLEARKRFLRIRDHGQDHRARRWCSLCVQFRRRPQPGRAGRSWPWRRRARHEWRAPIFPASGHVVDVLANLDPPAASREWMFVELRVQK